MATRTHEHFVSALRTPLLHGQVSVFRFRITDLALAASLGATAGGCRVTETWIDERGFIVKTLGKPVSGVGDRAAHNAAGMEQTLDALKAKAEADAQAKQQASLLSALPEDVREGFRYAQMLDRAAKGEPVYMMPFRLRIK